MTVTVVGDFADPLSFLASQRVTQITSLGLAELRWLAVESEPSRPLAGGPMDHATTERVRALALPGEEVPREGVTVPSSRAATAAYAESLTDGVPDAMRRALFDALWVQGRRVDDPDVIRDVVFRVLNPDPPRDLDRRVCAGQPLVPLGDPDPIATSRRLGFVVTLARAPLTTVGQQRLDAWRQLWRERGAPPLPLLVTELGEALAGEQALDWLAAHLAHRPETLVAPVAVP